MLAVALSSFYHFLEKRFDSVVDFAESLVAALEFRGVSLDLQVSIAVGQFTIVDGVCIVILGEHGLNGRLDVDQPPSHSVVLQSYQVVIHVVVARRADISKGLVAVLQLVAFAAPTTDPLRVHHHFTLNFHRYLLLKILFLITSISTSL